MPNLAIFEGSPQLGPLINLEEVKRIPHIDEPRSDLIAESKPLLLHKDMSHSVQYTLIENVDVLENPHKDKWSLWPRNVEGTRIPWRIV